MPDPQNASAIVAPPRGRVTVTIRERDSVILTSGDGSVVEVYLSRGEGGRATLAVDAPRSVRISRKERSDEA